MATVRWKGRALAVAQVTTLTVGGTWVANDTVTLTINSKNLVLTVGTTVTTTAIATAIKEMVNGDAITGDATRSETGNNVPEFDEITATVSGSVVTLTGDTKGRPFTLTSAKVSAAGTLTQSTTTAATGPNHWDSANNWDTGAVPVSTDDVIIDIPIAIKYGLAQSAVTLTSLTIAASFSGSGVQIGLPEINEDGSSDYVEYRDTYLAISATTVHVGLGAGGGSDLIKLNVGAAACTLNVYLTGRGAEDDREALLFKGTNVGNVVNVRGTSQVGIAVLGGETATVATLRLEDSAEVRCGSGTTLTTVQVNSGTLVVNSAIATSLTLLDGAVTLEGAGNVAQLNVRGGRCTYNTAGTLNGATVLAGAGVLDFEQDARAKTVTNPIELYGRECQLLDGSKVIASLVVDFNEGASEAQVAWGSNVRLTRGTPA